MPCYHPLTAYQCVDGSVVFSELRRYDITKTLQLPCGQCVGCRLERSRQWAMRCVHESRMHSANCFITLTYDGKHVPASGSLEYPDFQRFMKRLRKRFEPVKIRFYMCGEYGEDFGRPHFHACLFGIDFADKVLWKRSPSGEPLFRSKALEELWPFGFTTVGQVTFESAAYTARYIMKKVTGDAAGDHYGDRSPEFNHMSLKPGIGASWLAKYKADVYPRDYVVVNAKECKPPKFYDRRYSVSDPDSWEDIQFKRELDGKALSADNSDARLLVKEQVTRARLSQLYRGLT